MQNNAALIALMAHLSPKPIPSPSDRLKPPPYCDPSPISARLAEIKLPAQLEPLCPFCEASGLRVVPHYPITHLTRQEVRQVASRIGLDAVATAAMERGDYEFERAEETGCLIERARHSGYKHRYALSDSFKADIAPAIWIAVIFIGFIGMLVMSYFNMPKQDIPVKTKYNLEESENKINSNISRLENIDKKAKSIDMKIKDIEKKIEETGETPAPQISSGDTYYIAPRDDCPLAGKGPDHQANVAGLMTCTDSLEKIHNFLGLIKPGDTVLLQRGSVWQDGNAIFDALPNGTPGHPTVLDAFGDGVLPILKLHREILWRGVHDVKISHMHIISARERPAFHVGEGAHDYEISYNIIATPDDPNPCLSMSKSSIAYGNVCYTER